LDRFIVKDSITEPSLVGKSEYSFEPAAFEALYKKVTSYLSNKVFVRDSYVCADPNYRLNVRAYGNTLGKFILLQYVLRPEQQELENSHQNGPYYVPSFLADPATDGTRQNFAILDFTEKIALIGVVILVK
jgi:phosphoenolpyruvate carboxykinase (ATP)